MKMEAALKIRFAGLALSLIASAMPAALSAQDLSLSGSGAGLWAQHGRPKFRVNRIAVNGSGKNAKIEFVLTNGAKRSLDGKAAGQGESSFFWKINHAGNSKAQGSVWIGTRTNDEVGAAYASGTIEGQPFLAQFNAIPTVRLNFLTEGSGAWASGKGDELKLSGFGLMSDIQAKASAVFFLADGSQRRFTGRVKKRIAKPRAVILALQNAGEANASGELRVRFTEKNHIVSVTGPGKLDGQPFKINFEASLEAAERAEVFEEKLGTLTETKGKVARGDAATQFTAWSDESGVRFVEALVDQGDYGSSHRKLFYESGKLVHFSEKGQVRDTSSKAQGRMNLVETAISFSPLGKVEAASKMLNGKPAKLTPYDAPAAIEYAEMVRKAAEGSKRTR
jgi:hypothetical protein